MCDALEAVYNFEAAQILILETAGDVDWDDEENGWVEFAFVGAAFIYSCSAANRAFGTLYLVPTPIGNLSDFTPRAVDVLKEVAYVLAEDTRTEIDSAFRRRDTAKAFHQHNEHKSTSGLVQALHNGQSPLFAPMPVRLGISDPAFLLVRACVEADIPVVCLPGWPRPSCPLWSPPGIMRPVCFEGFLPRKKGRQKRLGLLAEEQRTVVFYESPHRIVKLLKGGNALRPRAVGSVRSRDQQLHEQTVRGTVADVLEHFSQHEPKGEFVVVVAGKA